MADISVTAANVRPLEGAIKRRGTAAGSGNVGNVVYLGSSGWQQADADASASAKGRGIVVGVNGQPGATSFVSGDALDIVRFGPVSGFASMTPGAHVFVSGTAGAAADTAGAYPWIIGVADAAGNLFVNPMGPSADRTGHIPLPLAEARLIATNDIAAVAAAGGVLGLDTAPKLKRVNAATDKKLRIEWAASSVVPITWDIPYPNDLDDAATVVVKIVAAMAASADTPTIAVNYFEGVGDTNAGGNTAAVTGTTPTVYSRTIAAADVGAYPVGASIELVPAAHGTDALYIYSAWLEYTKK